MEAAISQTICEFTPVLPTLIGGNCQGGRVPSSSTKDWSCNVKDAKQVIFHLAYKEI